MNRGLAPDLAANEPSIDYGQKALDIAASSYLAGRRQPPLDSMSSRYSIPKSYLLFRIPYQIMSSRPKCIIKASIHWPWCLQGTPLLLLISFRWSVFTFVSVKGLKASLSNLDICESVAFGLSSS